MVKKRGQEGRTDPQGKRPGLGSLGVSGERDRTRPMPRGMVPSSSHSESPWSGALKPRRGGRGMGAPHRDRDRQAPATARKTSWASTGEGAGTAGCPSPPRGRRVTGPPKPRLLPHRPAGSRREGGVPRPGGRSGGAGAPWGLPRRRTPAKDTGYTPAGGTSSAAGSPGSGRKRRRGPAPGRAASLPPSRRCPPPWPPAPAGPRPRTGH